MEGDDGKIFYSVLTRQELRDKVVEAVDEISEFFAISDSDATLILIRLKWNSFEAKVRLIRDKERLMEETGLVYQNVYVSPYAHPVRGSEDDGRISTPYCLHKFCKTCWRDYLIESMKRNNKKKEEEKVMPLCINRYCTVPVGPDIINRVKDLEVMKMYQSYIVDSFVEGNKKVIKLCPRKGCDYAISLCEDVDVDVGGFDVVCRCGHIFCWSCKGESHRPVTCEKAFDWLNRHLYLAKNLALSKRYNKRCPNCNTRVESIRNPALSLMTCTCSYRFCARCFRSEEDHIGITNCIEVFNHPSKKRDVFTQHTGAHFDYVTDYMLLWDAIQKELDKDQAEVDQFEFNRHLTENFGYDEQDVNVMGDAFRMVIQCRLVQKWSCVYDNYTPEHQITNKQYVTRLRGEADKVLNRHIKTFKELVRQGVGSDDFSGYMLKLSESTANTGKFFRNLVENFEDGLPEDDEDVPKGFWFWYCDSCTFLNTRFDVQCKMCFAPVDSSVPPPMGSNIASSSKSSANNHQEVPDSGKKSEE